MSFQPWSYIVTLDEVRSKIEACFSDINEWMTDNKLKLNNNKTELLILHAYHRLSPSLDSVYADTELIKASESVRNSGFVQNSAACLLSFTRKTEHITPILKEFHWLPVAVRIEFKILVLVFKAYHGIAPLYTSDMITKYELTRS